MIPWDQDMRVHDSNYALCKRRRLNTFYYGTADGASNDASLAD